MPLAVQKLSPAGEPSHVCFLNPSILPPAQPPKEAFSSPDAYLLAHCTDGSLSLVRCGYDGAGTVKVIEPATESIANRVIMVQPLTGIPQVVIVVRGGGEVTLVDVRRDHALCLVALRAADCKLTAVVPPVLTPAANAQMLYIKGVKDVIESDGTSDTCMFVFPLRSFPALDPFMKNRTDPQPFTVHITAQKRFDSLLSNRYTNGYSSL